MSYSIGQWIGGALAIFIVASIVEWLLISRIMNNPRHGTLVSVAIAFSLAVFVYGYVGGNGLASAIVGYLPGAILVGAIQLWRTRKASEPRDQIEDVFE